jgi:2-dehydro-3-deoxyphosphogluconate aldolase / (4S)-4-hydroxy-2-oxoglutarate aldolase
VPHTAQRENPAAAGSGAVPALIRVSRRWCRTRTAEPAASRASGLASERRAGEEQVTPHEFVEHLWRERATAILRATSQEVGAAAMDAAVRGGFRVVEFTLTTPGALELVAEMARRPEVCVGAGTVLTVDDARRAVGAGARFLVAPNIDDDVVAEAARLGVAMLPGVHTPTEMLRAHRAGAPLLKLFPAPAGGPAYLRSCLGPLPFLRVVPTNGVDLSNAASWIEAGAWAVGFVGSLFDPELLARGAYDAIEERARALLTAVRVPSRTR